MALRNAFDLLATEGTLRQLLRQLTFPRTTTDTLRVNVDNTVSTNIYQANASASSMQGAATNVGPWANNSWNMIDARYQFGEMQVNNFETYTRGRWTIT